MKPERASILLVVSLGLLLGLSLPSNVRAGEWREPFSSARPTDSSEESISAHSQGVILPTSDFVLYSRYDSSYSCWLLDDAGDRQIIANCQFPRLSPDGRYIVYRDGDIHYGDLHVLDLQSDTDTEVFANDDYVCGFAWTPDGSQIVFDYECYIYAIDRDGTDMTQLTGAWPPSGYCNNDAPHSNPVDGRLAWLNWSYYIAVANHDGTNPGWVPNTTYDDVYPVWSPDGLWIAFLRDYGDLYKIHPDGTGLTQLTFLTDPDWIVDMGGWAWTADGKWLVIPAEIDGARNLYAVASNGSGQMIKLATQESEAHDFVGSAGILEFFTVYLPVVLKE